MRTSNGANQYTSVEGSYKGDGCIGSNNVTSSSDSAAMCMVDSSSTTTSDRTKLTVQFVRKLHVRYIVLKFHMIL
jgi:hypothetical protein